MTTGTNRHRNTVLPLDVLLPALFLVLVFSTASCIQGNGDPDAAVPSQQDLSQAGPGTETDRAAAQETDWTSEYEQMNAVLDLSDQEKAELKAASKAGDEAVAQWQTKQGAKLARLEQEMKEAAEDRDRPSLRRARAQAEPLRNEFRELVKTHQSNLREALSPEHRLQWEAHQLAVRILDLMQPLDLSEEQVSRVRTEAISAVRASANEPNPKAAAYLELEQAVELNVLTAEQRQTFQEIKKKNPMRSLK